MSEILITGATGLVGSHLVAELAGSHRVWALGRRPEAADARVSWLAHDLAQPSLPEGLPDRIDAVIHLAQSPRFREFPEQAPHVFEVNTASTMRLLDWARAAGARHFVYASTGGVYGFGEAPFGEEAPLPPSLPFYPATKRAGELLVDAFAGCMTTVNLRFFFVYGAGQKSDMLIPRLARSVANGQPIKLQGPDGIRINPLYAGDAARAVARCMTLECAQTINVAGPEALSLRQIGEALGALLGREVLFEADEAARPNHLMADIAKQTALLGAPETPFARGARVVCDEVRAESAAS